MFKLTGYLVVVCVAFCSCDLAASDFAPADKDAALQGVKDLVAEAAKSGKAIDAWLTVLGTRQKVRLVSSDARTVGVKIDGVNVFQQPWDKIPPDQIAALARTCVQDDAKRALAAADYCMSTGQADQADQALSLAAQLDKSLGTQLSDRFKFAASMRGAPPAPAPGTAATATGSTSTDGAAAPNTPNGTSGSTAAIKPASVAPNRGNLLSEITDFSLAGMDRRMGPDYAFYHKGQKEKLPEIYMPPRKEGAKGHFWEIGGPWSKESGDFSSTQGQVLYTPDKGFGVDRVTILEMSNSCFSEKPEPPWHGGFRPEPASKSWLAAGGNPGAPVFMARGMGTWSNSGVIVFSTGLVGVAGTCTARGTEPCIQLPRNKIPTAISVTNKNEFALITVCDVETMKGQVAVIALESSAKKTGFAHEWNEDHPCLANVAVFTRLKLLGFVDLPGVSAPSGICAVGDTCLTRLNGADGNQTTLREFDLSKPNGRESFDKGSNSHYCSRSGFAVVISRRENKVVFLDLQPLFKKVHDMYFTTDENYQKTLIAGPEPKQWPFTFEADPSWKPVVVKTMDQPQPTAVLAQLDGGKKACAFVASEDGRTGMYHVGGLATEDPALPDEIKCVGLVQLGKNPVCLAYQKYSSDTFIAVSRGDREIEWVRHNDKGLEIVKRLRDDRMMDPVHVEVADTHGIGTAIITVSDFKGRKIINYRYGHVSGGKQQFVSTGGGDFGMGPDGKDEYECGGVLDLPGSPFCISATNVN